jgi:hypothetical protein
MKQTQAGAVSGSTVDRESTLVTRFDPDAFVPGNGMADARLGTRRGNYDWFANGARSGDQCRESGCVDPIVVGDEKFHGDSRYTVGVGGAILAARGWRFCFGPLRKTSLRGGQIGAPYITTKVLSRATSPHCCDTRLR